MKTVNQKAWFFVLPVLLLVAFNALIPMMTVVNYAVQETFGNNVFFWSGLRWFEELLHSEQFHAALGRQFLFTGIILAIEVPLGVVIALAMPRQGPLSDKAGLQMAIAHELQHMRQGDVTWEIGLEGLRLLFFWNPAFLLWKRSVDRLRELACDQQLLARGRFDPAACSDCLLRICRNGLRQRQLAIASIVGMVQAATPILGADPIRFLRYRITSVLAVRPPRHGRRFGLLLLGPLAATIAFSAVALQHHGDWSHDRLMLSTIVNLERLRSNQGY